MAIVRTLQCPDCMHEWRQYFHRSTDPYPRFCPNCGVDVSGEGAANNVVTLPSGPTVHTGHTGLAAKAGDQTYRAMEAASEARVAHAAEMTGLAMSELSDMKITNLRDDNRVGENSLFQQSTEVHKFMEGPGRDVTGFQANASQFRLGRPAEGAATAGVIQTGHMDRVNATVNSPLNRV